MNVTQLRKSQLSRGFVNKDMARYVICDDDVTQTYERGAHTAICVQYQYSQSLNRHIS